MDKSKALQKATLGGSILAAITASLCCIGPLVAVALGASGFAASAVFEKWRPVFLDVTFALLALAWYLTYRKPKTTCEEGSACATKPRCQMEQDGSVVCHGLRSGCSGVSKSFVGDSASHAIERGRLLCAVRRSQYE